VKTVVVPFRFEFGSVAETDSIDTIVRQQIADYFMTTKRERIMRASYGGNLSSFIFELIDPLILTDYKTDVLSDVNTYLSFGQVIDLYLQDESDSVYSPDNSMTLVVKYAVAPRTVSTVRLTVGTRFTEESDI
jgi:hypothetical protein